MNNSENKESESQHEKSEEWKISRRDLIRKGFMIGGTLFALGHWGRPIVDKIVLPEAHGVPVETPAPTPAPTIPYDCETEAPN